jgi:hypothetical protein
MKTRDEYAYVASELNDLRKLRDMLPADRMLERIGLDRRLAGLTAELESLQPRLLSRKLKLTFRGAPVVGSSGVFSDFATLATGRLTEAIKAVAAGLRDALKYMGPIPGAAESKLLITGVAKGSFGFVFEVPKDAAEPEAGVFDGLNQTELAVEKVRQLMETAATVSDDETLAEIIEEVHPRAVRKVKDFLDALSERDALCAYEFDGKVFRFTDMDQLRRGRDRLAGENIKESAEEFVGEIQGVLPKSRTIEFKIAGKEDVIRARIGPDIEDADILNRSYLHRPSTASMQVVQVGQGRPRYILNTLPTLHDTPRQ